MFPFVPFSHTKNVAQEPQQAYEAALQFGRFTYLLSGFDATLLKMTIPSFHDLSLRYENFVAMLKKGNIERIAAAEHLILAAFKYKNIVDVYESIKVNPDFKTRVTHHDTKISNVLFDNNDKGICVIDLDTTMPGYFISDVGDMLRTYVCPVSEEETDYDKICIRPEFYEAIVTGYYAEMKSELTVDEKNSFFYAGSFMIYMLAIRLLSDYLDDDHYYGAKYEGHNLTRAGNQFVLLQKYLDAENKLAYISANL